MDHGKAPPRWAFPDIPRYGLGGRAECLVNAIVCIFMLAIAANHDANIVCWLPSRTMCRTLSTGRRATRQPTGTSSPTIASICAYSRSDPSSACSSRSIHAGLINGSAPGPRRETTRINRPPRACMNSASACVDTSGTTTSWPSCRASVCEKYPTSTSGSIGERIQDSRSVYSNWAGDLPSAGMTSWNLAALKYVSRMPAQAWIMWRSGASKVMTWKARLPQAR
ncbi:hypothetical protein RR42_m1801 [Cupriavidus basilensis]|uniref:Uncharacterized protein n=1 Tax=Cupriavidus basilensis TaxID=68895 RepID=A0A0C4Y8C7_9BURK|nr:hypothetical protein RR42_m1801 [Cupriavidus basilensis]